MKMNILYVLCCIVFFCTACTKVEPCDTDCDLVATMHGKMGNLDTVWTSYLLEDRSSPGSQRGIIAHDKIVLTTFQNDPIGMIAAYNVEGAGNNIWRFREGHTGFISTFVIPEKNLIANKSRFMRISLDIKTGAKIQEVRSTEFSGARGILLGNYIYYDESEDNDRTVHLRRSPVGNLEIVETLYTLDNSMIVNSKKSINSMNIWVNPIEEDSILIFQHRMLGRVDVVAWSLKDQLVKWRHDNLTRLGNSNHQQILVHNNKAYFGGGTTFYCFDMFTGEIVWEFDHPSGINAFMFFSPCIADRENAVIVKDADGSLWGFDLDQGFVKMRSDGSDGSSVDAGSPIYHKGIVYFNERRRLFAVDAADGRILWQESSSPIPFGPTSFNGELAIDAEKGILYACSHDKLFAIKVIEK